MIVTVTPNPAIDHAIYLDRLTPGDVNRVRRTRVSAGGKGVNVARTIHALGGEVLATGFLAGENGRLLRSGLGGLPHQFVEVEGETRRNININDGSGPPTSLNEAGPRVPQSAWGELCALIAQAGPRWVALCGALPPGQGRYSDLAELPGLQAVDADGEVLVDALGLRPALIKPNENEVERLLGRRPSSPEDGLVAADALRERYDVSTVVVSMGAMGAAMAGPEGRYVGTPPVVEVVSTLGCGDSMLGALLWALDSGRPHEEALRWGLAVGAAVARSEASSVGEKPLELLGQTTVRSV